MEILKGYVRGHKRGILFCGLFVLIFTTSFYLYDLPLGAVIYPTALCLVLGSLFLIGNLKEAQKKHRQLLEISEQPAALLEKFPVTKSQDDLDYQRIIEHFQQEHKQLLTDMNIQYQDMIEYYTVWAHQIKTPIAAMRLTLQNEDTSVSKQLFDELQRIEQYVEMVLAFLRLDSESKDYVFREQDLDEIVKESVKKFAGQFIRKRLRLCYEPLGVKVLTDEKWLSFVLEQVLSNALKYTNTGSITIALEEPRTLCIRDTGIGIASEDLPRVFEKSYTGYNGRSDKKASGIGLYLCKRICGRLGHQITIESVVEEGTVVRICLEHANLKVE